MADAAREIDVRWPLPRDAFHVALTGHRPPKLDGYDLDRPFYGRLAQRLRDGVSRVLETNRSIVMHSGMALGADTVWSTIALEAREHYGPERVGFVAHVPVRSQPDRWSVADQQRWREHLALADTVIVYASEYSTAVMSQRNRGMVDAADLLVAVWDGSTSGTGYAVRYAEQTGTAVGRLHPEMFRAD